MKRDNVVKDMSFRFAIRIVRLFQYLQSEKREFVLSKQILRSRTRISRFMPC
ncbi:MAG: four helix bundle protein [Dysgonamonadaceae bacterium]|nr:four helix bundle protein [Dysgonamonadaceae bacterium]MDD4728182.1 four helix bundle protein [Dysgonamonadaceae bacterium]